MCKEDANVVKDVFTLLLHRQPSMIKAMKMEAKDEILAEEKFEKIISNISENKLFMLPHNEFLKHIDIVTLQRMYPESCKAAELLRKFWSCLQTMNKKQLDFIFGDYAALADLPHHVSTRKEIDKMMLEFQECIKTSIKNRPKIV